MHPPDERTENREELLAFGGCFLFPISSRLQFQFVLAQFLPGNSMANAHSATPTSHKLACALGVDFRLRLS